MRSSRSSGGSSAAGVSQYRIKCGLRSASFEQPPGVPRRDRLDNAPPDNFVRQFTVTPLTDRSTAVSRPFTCQSDDLANLLGCELRRRAGFRCIRQAFGRANFFQRHLRKLQPTSSPVAWGFVSTPNSRAICKLFHPSPASNTMRARNASCWPVVYARTKRSSSARSRSFSTTLGGLGVAIVHSGQIKMLDLTRLWHKSRLHSADVY